MSASAEIVVVSAADERFFPGLLVALCSVAWYADRERPLRLVVLDGGILDASYDRLRSQIERIRADARVERFKVAEHLVNYSSRERVTSMNYARLWIPDLVEGPRALYIDADVLALSDVAPLFDTDLGECVAAAARDPGVRILGRDCPWVEQGTPISREPYFNTGVLLLDLDVWRREKLAERTFEWLAAEGTRCFWGDQTALNFLLLGRVVFVPEVWNHATARYVHRNARPARILHFMWPVKPWLGAAESDAYELWRVFASRVAGIEPSVDSDYRRAGMRRALMSLYLPARVLWQRFAKGARTRDQTTALRYWERRAAEHNRRRRSGKNFRAWLLETKKSWVLPVALIRQEVVS